ncbi:type I polyketide synthase [Cellvibrio sp. QJXJ]|uniref:type I polyketide synthase n=1 Tax=Cellvibrio sp. QJXJ TaxID=2964606 RepID=UPI0021C49CE7|nr:type I polyketide synthase [Cellvibrio sp. QJXJ]UUA73393.1 type I polyketide synthase [Cellvibrio sp. QJXJ]
MIVMLSNSKSSYEFCIDLASLPFISDHCVGGNDNAVVPATFYKETIHKAFTDLWSVPFIMENVYFYNALSLQQGDKHFLSIEVNQTSKHEARCEVFLTHSDSPNLDKKNILLASCTANTTGVIVPDEAIKDINAIKSRCSENMKGENIYERLESMGYFFGPLHQGLKEVWIGTDEAVGVVECLSELNRSDAALHPAFIDSFSHIALALLPAIPNDEVFVTLQESQVQFFGVLPNEVYCHVTREESSEDKYINFNFSLFNASGELLAIIRGYRMSRIATGYWDVLGTSSRIRQGYFNIHWHNEELPASLSALEGKVWVVLSKNNESVHDIARMIVSQGGICIRVFPGESYCNHRDHYEIRLKNKEDYVSLVSDLMRSGAPKIGGVLHLLSAPGGTSIDNTNIAAGVVDTASVNNVLDHGLYSVLYFVQALGETGINNLDGFIVVSDKASELMMGCVTGLGCTIHQEFSDLNFLHIISSENLVTSVEKALVEVFTDDRENLIELRNGNRFVPRLEPLSAEDIKSTGKSSASNATCIDPQGSYVVTGGLGEIGLELAQWLVDEGAGAIYLLARSEPSDKAKSLLKKWESSQSRVYSIFTDISDKSSLEQVLNELRTKQLPFKGVFHSAGTTQDGLLVSLDREGFEKVLAPKVLGALWLHALTRKDNLDFTVYFSSVTTVIGQAGVGNYAAANAFLNTLASCRSESGFPTLSMQWGPWKTGMFNALSEQQRNFWDKQGFRAFDAAEGIYVLKQTLIRNSEFKSSELSQPEYINKSNLGYFPIDWGLALARKTARELPSLLKKLVKPDSEEKFITQDSLPVIKSLEASAVVERVPLLEEHITRLLESVMNFGLSTSEFDSLVSEGQTFQELGVSSITAVELTERLQDDLALQLQPTLLFNYPTVFSLAEYLLSRLDMPVVEEEKTPQSDGNEDAVVDTDDMDEVDLVDFLDQQIEELNLLLEE